MSIKNLTRIDVFKNADEALKFYEFAIARGAKTREEMERALTDYKKADLMVEGCKEHVEAQIAQAMNAIIAVPKGDK